ncbi:Protein arginine N-methyltransferase 7 [Coccomyxa sp. Obi]|nr:Protein arginine N-methyltransferase 7 [Coccomyxa sp. Obi]
MEKHKGQFLFHKDLSNRAAAFLALELWQQALADAERARTLAEAALKRSPKTAAPAYIKTFMQKGAALMGMGRHREASLVLEEASKMDPLNCQIRLHLEAATQGILKDLLEGKGKELRLLTAPEPTQRITYHPHSAPLHKIKTDNMLPTQLLTPFQADNDHHVKDTYNYVTVQADVKMPGHHFGYLEDDSRAAAFERAIREAVDRMHADDKDARVLNLGCGTGLHAMMALRAGAEHVTAVDRWLYMALACKESLVANNFSEDHFSVIYKRPTDLAIIKDVPICCNILICDMFDEGLLTSGIIPAVRHCMHNILADDAILLPAAATVYMQAAEVRTGTVCGIDMGAVDRHRWTPAFTTGVPLGEGLYRPLSEPVEAWHFDVRCPPDESGRKTIDVEFTSDGICNAVVFWFTLELIDGITISSAPGGSLAPGMQPALQYLAGELRVDAGEVLPVLATHNTVRLRFDIEEAEYLHLAKPDAAFPVNHFSMLADTRRNQAEKPHLDQDLFKLWKCLLNNVAYQQAIERAVERVKAAEGEVHALDMGCGTGLFAAMAARAGASSVVACDLHDGMCTTARKVVAANGLSERVSVVHKDIALLERGHEVRYLGCNLAIADLFDAGLLGNNWLYLLDMAKKNVLQPGATVVPAAATLYCMGIEARTGDVRGFDFSAFNKYRWDKQYSACYLDDMPHKRLTRPAKVFEYFFDGMRKGRGRENILRLEVLEAGHLNAIAFWFDLHLDDELSISTAPACIGLGGELTGESSRPAAAGSANPFKTKGRAAMRGGNASNEENTSQSRCGGFMPAKGWSGCKPGWVFKTGDMGLGYYADDLAPHQQTSATDTSEQQQTCQDCAKNATSSIKSMTDSTTQWSAGSASQLDSAHSQLHAVGDASVSAEQETQQRAACHADKSMSPDSSKPAAPSNAALSQPPTKAQPDAADTEDPTQCTTGNAGASMDQFSKKGGGQSSAATASKAQRGVLNEERESRRKSEEDSEEPSRERHYWGQALQYLDKSADVVPGKKVTVLARREGGQVSFRLREGVGDWVDRAPWRIEWGGGSSVENPHYQRVHYCQLLVSDFLMRVKSGRFPSIEKDMKMVLAHCGSLFLDPASLWQVYHEMVVLERIHTNPHFSPGVSLEALTRPPLRLH